MNTKKIVQLLQIIILLTFLIPKPYINALDTTIYVDDDNTTGPWQGTQNNPYNTIQKAIHNAPINATIKVLPGNYTTPIHVNKTLRLIGTDKTQTILIGTPNQTNIHITAQNITLTGFTITNSSIGIQLTNTSNTTITNNTITKNNYGIKIAAQSNNNLIYYNNFLQNDYHAEDSGTNQWSEQNLILGNFWSSSATSDTNSDGISDNPYQIPGGLNQDDYPLMQPITTPPQPSFTYHPLQPTTQDTIQFNDTSQDSDGWITTWIWSFGDGNNSQTQHASYRYSDNGIYQVALTITDNYGATTYIKTNITVYNTPPIARFEYCPINPTDIESVNFIDNSIDLDGTITNWYWVFGDGNSSYEQNPDHQYNDDGMYTVVLQITDDDSDMHQITQQIEILNVPPNAKFIYTPSEPTINDTLKFSDHSTDSDGKIISWLWNFDDGETSDIKSPQHHFPGEGTYQVSLVVTDNDGESSTISKYIIVYPLEPPTQTIEQTILIYVFYLIMFIAMIVFVFFIIKKSQK